MNVAVHLLTPNALHRRVLDVQVSPKPALDAASPEIPDKLYFRIGDVARLAAVKPYVLRYWETEFPAIAPKKTATGHRLYRRKDVELILEIKHLLYEKRFTIEGARKAIDLRGKTKAQKAETRPAVQPDLFPPQAADLEYVRRELQAILTLLDRKSP